MLSTGRDGEPPSPAGQYLVDAVTASTAFEGVLAALLHRERTGEGQLVHGEHARRDRRRCRCRSCRCSPSAGKPQERSAEPHAHVYIRAPYGVFETSDGYLALAFPKMAALAQGDRRARAGAARTTRARP